MKKYLILFVLAVLVITLGFDVYAKDNQTMRILFTHDLHDHFDPYDVVEDGIEKNIGGFARISQIIKKEREKGDNLLVVDAGDFSMGTLYQTIYGDESPSLRLLGEMGFDITTLGNHEFDFRAKGLADSLLAAKNSEDKLPKMVISNVDFDGEIDEDVKEDVENLKIAFKEYGVKDYEIIEKNGYKIGVFGLLGDEAISNAPMAGVAFKDYIEEAKRVVAILKEEEVDMILCLSHSGTHKDVKKSEDEILAREVPEIDLIISGHSHTTIENPIIVGNTIVVSSGNYGENVGYIELNKNEERWKVKSYELIPVDDKVEKDPYINERIGDFKSIVQRTYLNRFNLKFDQVIGHSSFNFTEAKKLGQSHGEDTLANLITDSYIHMLKELEGNDYEPTIAIVPAGTIRDSFTKGNITVSDVFNVSSLGIGPDEISGYPLISVYLTGKDLKTAAEVDASIAPLMSVAQLYMSGMNYEFNPSRLIFSKVTDAYLLDENGNRMRIKDDEQYRIVAGLYTGQMLSIVKDQSFGLLSIVPRDKDGNEIVDFEDHIIYDGRTEVKEWYALANYINSFKKRGKVPEIPEKYNGLEGRKVINDDSSIKARLKNPNKIMKAIFIIIGLVVAGFVFGIKKYIRRKKGRITLHK